MNSEYIMCLDTLTRLRKEFIAEPINQQTVEKIKHYFHRLTWIPYQYFRVGIKYVDKYPVIVLKYFINEKCDVGTITFGQTGLAYTTDSTWIDL